MSVTKLQTTFATDDNRFKDLINLIIHFFGTGDATFFPLILVFMGCLMACDAGN